MVTSMVTNDTVHNSHMVFCAALRSTNTPPAGEFMLLLLNFFFYLKSRHKDPKKKNQKEDKECETKQQRV